ncbi:hypothetical protein JR316_0005608 [Psilocybe cubensis]|uniref:Uncharacterized protein n=2 Tax=Psilocybe cubensis TaxID=181762 RepID=A0A8H7XZN0_PSICU|nr:hypothetical protein JR316_0005608 [Psilocybe cubensis]KAH9481089.1 hypothetical protein JR316_0005608 [Psilocybe cubensis]
MASSKERNLSEKHPDILHELPYSPSSNQLPSPPPDDREDQQASRDTEKVSNSLPSSVVSAKHHVQEENAASRTPKHDDISLFRCSLWVVVGVSLTLSGIFVVRHVLLPRVYRCPDGAKCHDNLDPRGHIIPRIQTLMQYWLKAGTFIASLGLSELIACNARLVLRRRDDATILAVERGISAAEGSLAGAALQITAAQSLYRSASRLWQGGGKTRPGVQHGVGWLGFLALSQIAIGLFISFIVGFSIPDLHSTTTVRVSFTYPDSFTLPRADTRFFSTDERIVAGVLDSWLVVPNSPHIPSAAFDGSLVVQDNRTTLAVDSRPSGFHISGEISCGLVQGWNVSIIPPNSQYIVNSLAPLPSGVKAYNFSTTDVWTVGYSNVRLAGGFVTFPQMSNSVTSRQYLWTGNNIDAIPNATVSSDGKIFYTICNHTIHLNPSPSASQVPSSQLINPSTPIIFTNPNDPFLDPCPSSDPYSCVAWSVDDVIAAWWSTSSSANDLVPFSCPGGVLAGFQLGPDTADCALNSERWTKTLNTALSAVIFSAPLSGNTTQDLLVPTEAINRDRWLIQLIIPGSLSILYLVCIGGLFYLSRMAKPPTTALKPLDLVDILCTKQYERHPDDIHISTVHIL